MDTFLGRALTDPATGLPNIPYFRMIQNWEERRARRRRTLVRVVRLRVAGGSEGAHLALLWRLCQELRTSDLIASDGREHFRILLTTPDAEEADSIGGRIIGLAASLNAAHPSNGDPMMLSAEIERGTNPATEQGPCDPCDERDLDLGHRDGDR